jgi:hypothetical protein
METPPIRLRLSRSPGFNLQAVSVAANGLPAVNVARPSRWGNKISRRLALTTGETAVAAFKSWFDNEASNSWREEARFALRGKNLACWCALDAPCHADVLLAFANLRETNADSFFPGAMDSNFSCRSQG